MKPCSGAVTTMGLALVASTTGTRSVVSSGRNLPVRGTYGGSAVPLLVSSVIFVGSLSTSDTIHVGCCAVLFADVVPCTPSTCTVSPVCSPCGLSVVISIGTALVTLMIDSFRRKRLPCATGALSNVGSVLPFTPTSSNAWSFTNLIVFFPFTALTNVPFERTPLTVTASPSLNGCESTSKCTGSVLDTPLTTTVAGSL